MTALFYFPMGAVLIWLGWRHWHYRKEETITLLEAAILKTTGVQPLPRKRIDRILTYAQAFLGFVLGTFFLLIGALAILNELGLL